MIAMSPVCRPFGHLVYRLLRHPLLTLRAGLLAVLLCGLVGGCATGTAPPAAATLLQDALFDHPPRPADADSVLALSPAMLDHLQTLRTTVQRPSDWPMALATSLYRPGGLQLDYDASSTRNAAQAFAQRAGNCLSLVVMTAALARDLGLEVVFQRIDSDDQYRSEAALTLRSGHVNLVLTERMVPQLGRQASTSSSGSRHQVVIDFLPPADAQRLPGTPIAQATVLAMFMNNRAVEALIARQPAQAYAWVREALVQDPGFWPAYNTLGVVYQRAGHLEAAATTFEQVLVRDATQVATLTNLAQLRHAQGRHAEAAQWEARLAALEPVAPFHFLRLGQAALAAGDWATARGHFRRELRQQHDSADAWFGLARVQLALGDAAAAEQALRQAQALSATSGERARYAGKLDALRALAAH